MEHEHDARVRRHAQGDASPPAPVPGRRTRTASYGADPAAGPATATATGPATSAEPTTSPAPGRTTEPAERTRAGGGPLPRLELGRAAHLDELADKFNREFAAQLHGFAAEPAPDAELGTERVSPTARSGEGVTAQQLAHLFTPAQLAKLARFLDTRQIPDRLFNGDEVGRATAQQRVLLSGHILAVGEYVPGSFAQQVHARMCGHWASLVYHYAGAAQGNGFAGRGVFENFDHAGNLSLSVSEDPEGGVRATSRESVARQVEVDGHVEGIAYEEFQGIQPGDWLWVYNQSGARGGNHSVIFSRWASSEMQVGLDGRAPRAGQPTIRYRRAITMSQTSPSAGGCEETRLLGERRVQIGDGDRAPRVSPITRRMSVDPSARPIQRMEDLVALLGSGREGRQNETFLRRRFPDNSFDAPRFITHLRGRNRELIEQLSRRMTPGQLEVFRTTNDAYEGDSEHGTLGTLVRLHQRLVNLVESSRALDGEGARTRGAAVESQRTQAEARVRPQRDALTAQHQEHVERIEDYEEAAQAAQEQIDDLDDASPELAELRARRRQRRPELNRQLRRARSAEDREQIREQLRALDAEFAQALAAEQERRASLRQAEREHRQLGGRIQRERNRDDQVQRQLRELRGAAGYHMVAEGIRGDTFQGRDQERVTGLLEDLTPAPTWSAFRVAESGGSGAEGAEGTQGT